MFIEHFSFIKGSARCLLMVAILASSPAKSIEIQAQALLKDMVVIVVDGTRRVIKAGDRSPEGVLLVTSSPHRAIVEVNGQRQQLTLSTQISSAFATKIVWKFLYLATSSINMLLPAQSMVGGQKCWWIPARQWSP